jgi:hypothetical protein
MCDFSLLKDKRGPSTTYFKEEGFEKERIKIFHNNFLEKTIMVLKFVVLFFL